MLTVVVYCLWTGTRCDHGPQRRRRVGRASRRLTIGWDCGRKATTRNRQRRRTNRRRRAADRTRPGGWTWGDRARSSSARPVRRACCSSATTTMATTTAAATTTSSEIRPRRATAKRRRSAETCPLPSPRCRNAGRRRRPSRSRPPRPLLPVNRHENNYDT